MYALMARFWGIQQLSGHWCELLKIVPATDGRVLYAATDRGSVRAYKLPLTGEMGEVRPVFTT